jgi:AcrR family transcriptional regulator
MSHDTRDQILDTAEKLFAERGIDAVSLRTLTAEAGVNLASVHYHFGSKEALVTAVFDRRVDRLNRERLEMLDAVEQKAGEEGPLPLQDVLRAFFWPAIWTSHQAGSSFMRLCGRMHAEPAEYVQKYFDVKFGPVIERFICAFHRSLPELSHKERGWRLHFTAGALVFTLLEGEKLKHYSHGLCDPANVEEAIEQLIQFTAAGLRAAALLPQESPADEQKTMFPPEEQEVTV